MESEKICGFVLCTPTEVPVAIPGKRTYALVVSGRMLKCYFGGICRLLVGLVVSVLFNFA